MKLISTQHTQVRTSQENHASAKGINRAFATYRLHCNQSTLSLLEAAGLKVIERDYQGYRMSFIELGGAA